MREKHNAAQHAHDQWRALTQNPVFVAAAAGLAGGVNIAIKALDDYHNSWEFPEDGYDLIAGVLADRNPDWLPDLITRRLTAEFGFGVSAWRLARRLVRLGVIARPELAEYTTAMPGEVGWIRAVPGLTGRRTRRSWEYPAGRLARRLLVAVDRAAGRPGSARG